MSAKYNVMWSNSLVFIYILYTSEIVKAIIATNHLISNCQTDFHLYSVVVAVAGYLVVASYSEHSAAS